MESLKGKVIAVTGASRGIGQAIAHEFAQRGANVVLVSRDQQRLDEVLRELPRKTDSRHLAVEIDIMDEESVNNGFDSIFNMFPDIDVLVNNAGIAFFDQIMDISGEAWDMMMKTNLKGAFLCTKRALPGMITKRSGHIFNISSVSGIKAFPYNTAYSASKAGLLAFGNSLREEVRKHGVKVVNIIPGATDTPIWDELNGEFDRSKMVDKTDIAKTILEI